MKIHPKAEVHSKKIGYHTIIWQYTIVLDNAEIGSNCNINAHCFIENDVKIGDNVTIKCGVYLWDGIRIEDNVQISPNVTFTNDLYPRAKKDFKLMTTIIKKGASIGANATLIAPLKIGKYAMIGAGSLIIKDVPDYSLWYGNPAKHMGYVTKEGDILNLLLKSKKTGEQYYFFNGELVKQ